jgi:exopolysaccharide production protein ExoQ
MNPYLALFLCTAFVCVSLIVDARKYPVPAWSWIPTLWAARVATRPLTNWFQPGELLISADGDPLDRNFLIILLLVTALVLSRRKVAWGRQLREHPWIFMFILFCGISVLWADFPGVGLKRWFRAVGTLLIIFLAASERDPVATVAAVIRRCAIVLLPFSVLVIKYFRDLGVHYNIWSGELIVQGVTTDKNALGRLAMICALFLIWQLMTGKTNPHVPNDRVSRLMAYVFISISMWLLIISNSKTSLACLVVGVAVMYVSGRPIVTNRLRYLGTWIVIVGGVGVLLDMSFDIQGLILQALHRNPTLTNRTFLWDDMFAWGTNPIVGVGYDTFWLGARALWFAEKYKVNEAHNGYLETYVEVGAVGVLLLAGILVSIFGKLKEWLATEGGVAYARLLAAMLAIFIIYNWTESAYKPTTFICFMLWLLAIAAPHRQAQVASAMDARRISPHPALDPRSARATRPHARGGD